MNRIVRPSAAKAAAEKMEADDDSRRLVIAMPIGAWRAIRTRAAQEGLTIKAYILGLVRRDGGTWDGTPGDDE